MRPGTEATRNIEEDLEDLDETDRAIELLGKRLYAQEQRIAQLERDGVDIEPAEKILANMRSGLKELIMHRALVGQNLGRQANEGGLPLEPGRAGEKESFQDREAS